jgi:hypothetical protein
VVVAGAGWVGVTDALAGFDAVTFWRRWSTTAGPLAAGFAGAGTSASVLGGAAGVVAGFVVGVIVGVVVGAGAGVLEVGVEVVVGAGVVVVSCVELSPGVVVTAPSVLLPEEGSAASAPAETGPSPAAVRPPPASAESSARQAHLRAP